MLEAEKVFLITECRIEKRGWGYEGFAIQTY